MTVCIAALSKWLGAPIVVGASDRMLTSGDIQFLPPQTKIYPLTNSINAMVAGDATIQGEIYPKVTERINKLISANPKQWVRVEDAASIYADEVLQYKKRTIARIVLEPLGLTWQTFLSKQKDLSADWLDSITDKVLQFRPEVRIIVAGLDEFGGHIWVIDGHGKISCSDKVGFAAIGIGKRHAESEFMFSGHTPESQFPETFLRIYTAKKRAEVAPGVGRSTDMFVVGGLGHSILAPDEEMASLPQLSQIYEEMVGKQDEAKREGNQKMQAFLQEELRKMAEQLAKAEDQQTKPSTPPPPSLPSSGGEGKP